MHADSPSLELCHVHTLPPWSYEQEKKMTGVGQMNVFMIVCVDGCVCLCAQKGLLIRLY